MLENAKILLTIHIEGGLVVRSKEEIKIPYTIRVKDLDKHDPYFADKDIKTLDPNAIVKQGSIPHTPLIELGRTRKCIITREAYDAWIDKNNPPYWLSFKQRKEWSKMSLSNRLHLQCQRHSEHFGGIGYSAEIME